MPAPTIGAIVSPTELRRDRAFRPDVEGLRAIAVGLVILYHAGISVFSGGYVGVDVFFVLSGFLITGLMMREQAQSGRIRLGEFYARRARRLLPAATVVLIGTVFASTLLLDFLRAGDIVTDGRWAAVFLANFRFASQGTDYLASNLPPSPLQHFWSLAVEEQFYLVWPSLFLGVALLGRRISFRAKLTAVLAVITVASFYWSAHLTARSATLAYFSPFTRAWELAVGALLAVATPFLLRLPRRLGATLTWAGLGGIVASAMVFSTATRFPGYAAAWPVVATLLAVAGGTIAAGGGAEVILGKKPFQLIGKLSYSLYLLHWPILIIAAGHAGHPLPVATNLALVGVALLGSMAMHAVIENPTRHSALLKRHAGLSIGFGLALVVLSVSVVNVGLSDHTPQPSSGTGLVASGVSATSDSVEAAVNDAQNLDDIPPVSAAAIVAARSDVGPMGKCRADRQVVDVNRNCFFGDKGAARTLVLLGDSHAGMWLSAFDDIGRRTHTRVVLVAKAACPAPQVTMWNDIDKRVYTECDQWRRNAIAYINELHPDTVVITSKSMNLGLAIDGKRTASNLSDPWTEGLTATLGQLSAQARRLVLLGDIPNLTESAPECLAANSGDVRACSTPREKATQMPLFAAERAAATATGAVYIDVVPSLCGAKFCTPVINGSVVYRDGWHITASMGRQLEGILEPALGFGSGESAAPGVRSAPGAAG
jgi:peptidoglycan/LPS O-acetylase OafA/YrhL